MFAFCDDKIAPEVTPQENYVGEHPFPGGERGNWLVVKCGGMKGIRLEVRSRESEVVGEEFQVGKAFF